MALIKCYECGKEISDQAKTCPNCGAITVTAKDENKKREDTKALIFFFCVVAAMVIGVAWIGIHVNGEEKKRIRQNAEQNCSLHKIYGEGAYQRCLRIFIKD